MAGVAQPDSTLGTAARDSFRLLLWQSHLLTVCAPLAFARYPSSALLPFLFWGLLIKAEQWEKGYPYY